MRREQAEAAVLVATFGRLAAGLHHQGAAHSATAPRAAPRSRPVQLPLCQTGLWLDAVLLGALTLSSTGLDCGLAAATGELLPSSCHGLATAMLDLACVPPGAGFRSRPAASSGLGVGSLVLCWAFAAQAVACSKYGQDTGTPASTGTPFAAPAARPLTCGLLPSHQPLHAAQRHGCLGAHAAVPAAAGQQAAACLTGHTAAAGC